MFRIIEKRELNHTVTLLEIAAPAVAEKAQAGQFVLLRAAQEGERIPLTIAAQDAEKGTITLIFQKIGFSTQLLGAKEVGESIPDLAGPLGKATVYTGMQRVVVVGGGVGCAIAYPQAKALRQRGAEVDVIAGFRSRDTILLEEELRAVAKNYYLLTEDGSKGEKGFVTDTLQTLIESGKAYDTVLAIGPVKMMEAVSRLTKPFAIRTIVSLNPIMIDGTGMCGCCRVTVGGKMRFACVDGPDFDGHRVDFAELLRRNAMYQEQEKGGAADGRYASR